MSNCSVPIVTIERDDTLLADDLERVAEVMRLKHAFPIDCDNWPREDGYKPYVQFHIAHNDQTIFIRYDVSEDYVMARVREDNGEVWTDSCAEFFIAFDDNGYYNLECSCIGKALLGFRKPGEQAEHAPAGIMQSIRRLPSLGVDNFEERKEDWMHWWLTLAIPASAFFRHKIEHLAGLEARINVYKCGDHLTKPHFLSYMPIHTPKPNFHVPEFFTRIKFKS